MNMVLYIKIAAKADRQVRIKTYPLKEKQYLQLFFEVEKQGEQKENLVALKQEIHNKPETLRSLHVLEKKK